MDNFPSLRTILDESKYVTGYEKEIDQLSDEKKLILQREENDDLERFRITILQLYEENKKMIKGPYVAEMELLKKEIKRIQKIHNDAIISIRKKSIKEKDVPVMEPSPIPMKRQAWAKPGDDLLTRIKSGDDLKRDVKQLSEEYQQKAEDAIKKAHIAEKELIRNIEIKYTKKREEFWEKADKWPREFEAIRDYLNMFDSEEKAAIDALHRNSTHVDALMRRKVIEEYNVHKEKNKKIEEAENSLANKERENDRRAEEAEDSLAIKDKEDANKEKEIEKEMEKKIEDAEMSLAEEDKNIYISSIINEKITVPFNKLSNNMTRYFESYAEKKIEGKCRNEGYVKKHSSSVISYSTGLLNSDIVIYDVIFSVDVCYPYENMELSCKIKNITKIGIRATISELNNPIILFISREHNPDKDFESYKENQIIKVKVLGNRFELNDEYISVIGELI
uniref:S1 motif domain-containing protein n=1 Tax=viral metagenome TaxID=1070528 RepID=A0A6C0ESU1_9ZZZZ